MTHLDVITLRERSQYKKFLVVDFRVPIQGEWIMVGDVNCITMCSPAVPADKKRVILECIRKL